MEQQLVVFELADEFYGVDIAAVESIIKLQPITKVPHAPGFIEGITNLRGAVLPVLDLRKRFGLGANNTNKNNRIVVVVVNNTKVGMIVDAVSEVLRVPSEAIEPPPSMVMNVDSTFITGIAKVNTMENSNDNSHTRLIILLDLRKILSVDESANLSSVAKVG